MAVRSFSRQDATFEVWFKPADLTTANQIIWETGGSGAGTMLTLSNSNLEFLVNPVGAVPDLTLATTLSDTNWHQFVGVINNTFDGTANDTIDLYLNGSLVSSSATANINDWAGGNQGGLGNFGGATFPTGGQVTAGSEVDFAGDLHLYRYYNSALTSDSDIQQLRCDRQPAVPMERGRRRQLEQRQQLERSGTGRWRTGWPGGHIWLRRLRLRRR